MPTRTIIAILSFLILGGSAVPQAAPLEEVGGSGTALPESILKQIRPALYEVSWQERGLS